MRELRWMLVGWLAAGPALAQNADPGEVQRQTADESGWFSEDPPAAPDAPSSEVNVTPAAEPTTPIAPAPAPHATEPPRLVLPPGQQAVIEPRCGRRAGSPIVVACAGAGRGGDPALDRSPERRVPPRKWYGWQTLVADLSIMGLFLSSLDEVGDDGSTAGLYLGATALTAPIIHFAHQQPGKAGISLAIRGGGMLLLGSMLGDSLDWESGESTNVLAALTLLLVHPAATALDAAVFARKPVREARQARRGPRLVAAGPTLVRSDPLGTSSRLMPGGFVSATF